MRYSLVLVLVLVSSMGGFEAAEAQTTRSGQLRLHPIGMVVLPHPAVTMQRILDWRKLGLRIPRPVYRGAMMVAMGLGQLVPELKGLTGLQLIDQFPSIAQKLGIQVNARTGVSFWQYGQAQIMVFSVKIEEKRLRQWLEPVLQSRQGKLLFRPSQGSLRQVYVQSPTGRKSPIGLLTGSWFHLLLPQTLNRKFLPRAMTFPILQSIHRIYPHILSTLFRRTITSDLRGSVAQQDADIVANINKRWMLRMLLQETKITSDTARLLPALRQYIPNLYAVLSLKQGLAVRVSLGWTQKAPALFALWKPIAQSVNWSEWIPTSIGWFGHSYINHLAIPGLIDHARKQGVLKPTHYAQMMQGWHQAKTEAEKLGIDLVRLFQSWSGEYAAGILWEDKMIQGLLAGNSPETLLRQSTFAALRFGNPQGATEFLDTVWKVRNALVKKGVPGVLFKLVRLGGYRGMEIQWPGKWGKVYLVSYQNMVLVAGSLDNALRFITLWNNKNRSLQELKPMGITDTTIAQQASRYAELHQGLRSQKGYFVLLPKVLHDLQGLLLAGPGQQLFTPLLERFHSLSLSSKITKQTYTTAVALQLASAPLVTEQALRQRHERSAVWRSRRSNLRRLTNPLLMALGVGISPSLLSDPMYTGILAAIAIPAFVRYTKRAKTSEANVNIVALRRSAITWFDDEHADTQGNPLPKHFPHTGKGWVCSPQAKPCASGRAMYSANPSDWKQEPWQSLRFGISKPHYFQYCYHSEGTGANARFTVRAHADLNCNGVVSTYEIKGWVNKIIGEVETSKITTTNPWE